VAARSAVSHALRSSIDLLGQHAPDDSSAFSDDGPDRDSHLLVAALHVSARSVPPGSTSPSSLSESDLAPSADDRQQEDAARGEADALRAELVERQHEQLERLRRLQGEQLAQLQRTQDAALEGSHRSPPQQRARQLDTLRRQQAALLTVFDDQVRLLVEGVDVYPTQPDEMEVPADEPVPVDRSLSRVRFRSS
jgi:hypothetical protein